MATKASKPVKMAFLKAAALSDSDECIEWPWGRNKQRGDYGQVTINGKHKKTHRLSLEIKLRRKLRDDEQAQHTCDNPPCVNGRHLKPGNNKSNRMDALVRGRWKAPGIRKGENHYEGKLTAVQVLEVMDSCAAGESYDVVARRYGVTPALIYRINNRLVWRSVTDNYPQGKIDIGTRIRAIAKLSDDERRVLGL